MTDGSGNVKSTGQRSITVNAVNDPPVLAGIEGTAWPTPRTARPRRSPPALPPATWTVRIWLRATIQITANYQNGQDVLSFTNTASITGSWNAATGTLT